MAVNLNPMYLMFPAAVATSFAFMLPVATGANAIVFSYGFVKVVDMVRLLHAHPPAINISLIPCHMKKIHSTSDTMLFRELCTTVVYPFKWNTVFWQ